MCLKSALLLSVSVSLTPPPATLCLRLPCAFLFFPFLLIPIPTLPTQASSSHQPLSSTMSDTDEPYLSSYDTDEDNAALSDSTIDDPDTRQARVDALLESIASIPPIVDILLSNLSYKDHLSCLHVCKLWSSIAQGYLWRHVRLRSGRAESVPLTPTQKTLIRRRARRIRSLATPLADTTFLDMPCTELESLEIWLEANHTPTIANPGFDIGTLHEAEAPLQTPHVGPSALDLIPMNRHLSSISFENIERLSRSFTPELFLSFSKLPLQSLHLGIAWYTSETLALAAFLTHCPVTLERLELSHGRRSSFFGQHFDEVSMTSEQATQLPWSPLPALKTLKMPSTFPIRDANKVVFPLLRLCPNLEELWMPHLHSINMATEFFNLILGNNIFIKALRLSPSYSYTTQSAVDQYRSSLSQDLLRVVNTYKSLRDVELEVQIKDEYPVIQTLVLNSGWSLEIIDLNCLNTEHEFFTNPYVTPILKNCNRLKRLTINDRGHGKGFVSLRDLVETNWASNQLESLTVLVSEKEYRTSGWIVEYQEDNEKLQEDNAMLLFQLSMKYRAQKNYTGPIPAWLESEAMLLPFADAVKYTDGAMSMAAWERIRPVDS
ncbi:hypothetical protein BKA57DRAFT_456221 [Linnemannia elongata]|nr:hypothetical protein BKA57DRAFT_456221 [Linnemannia elongata]